MTEREKQLRAGYVETHRKFDRDRDGRLYLYWEPYTEKGEYRHGFTVDHGQHRWRFQRFDDAVKHLEQYERELDIAAALKALGIQGGPQ